MSWRNPAPDWDTLAGRVIDRFLAGLSGAMPDYDAPLTVFGSAAIQLCLDDRFASADIDLMALSERESLRDLAKRLGAGRGLADPFGYGLQICPPQLFLTTPHYLQRAWTEERHGLKVVVPHVRDILIGKLHRYREEGQQGLAPKDRRAFERVRDLCGRPTDSDLVEDLRLCEAYLNLPADGSVNHFRLNAVDLFRSYCGRELDLKSEIFAPARSSIAEALGYPGAEIRSLLDELDPSRE